MITRSFNFLKQTMAVFPGHPGCSLSLNPVKLHRMPRKPKCNGSIRKPVGFLSSKQVVLTSVGGSHWSRFTLPIADHIYFSDPQTGWAVGGPTDDQLFKTQDGGATWKNGRPDDLPIGIQSIIYPPITSDGHDVFVMTSEGVENTLEVYTLQKSSNKWTLSDRTNLNARSGLIALTILDAQNFVATIPGAKSIVRLMDGKLDRIDNTDGLSAAIVELNMVSLDSGWAKSVESKCITESSSQSESSSVACSVTTRLLQ